MSAISSVVPSSLQFSYQMDTAEAGCLGCCPGPIQGALGWVWERIQGIWEQQTILEEKGIPLNGIIDWQLHKGDVFEAIQMMVREGWSPNGKLGLQIKGILKQLPEMELQAFIEEAIALAVEKEFALVDFAAFWIKHGFMGWCNEWRCHTYLKIGSPRYFGIFFPICWIRF
jgi:hypothetical protein